MRMELGNMSANSTEYSISVSDMMQVLFEVILMVFICTVNTLTLIVVCLNRNLWTIHNMYIISLAVADLLTGLSLAYQIVFHIPEIKALLDQNKYLCLCRHVVFFIMIMASVTNMVLIAVDRWACIAYPFKYEHLATIPKAGVLIAISWIIGIILGAVPLFLNNWDLRYGCLFFKVLTMEYQVYCQGGTFLLCSIIIAACYCRIFCIAKRQRNSINTITTASNVGTSERRMTKLKKDSELVMMFCVVFVVFFLCSAPAFIFVVVSYTAGVSKSVNSFTVPIITINSGMNFFIYVVKNLQFRAALKATCSNCRTTVVGTS
ncbi:adenosine receptor A2a-like [Gigantopelta aegis]|uniref:adenosine receptor A2a-like n=1 Tax=Gigantopelta aegis TaxID=1735272 RepID=UPI001B888E12|nr:adenosine receptor A2a-like [Gigantopelta aegis]